MPDEPIPTPDASAQAVMTIDVLRHVAGTAAFHIYEMEWLADESYVCNEFIGAGLESLLGPLPPDIDEEAAWEAAVHADDRTAYDLFGDALKRGHAGELEYRLVGFDGRVRWVWERARPREVAGRRLVDGIVADITERKRAADDLAAAQEKLAHLAYHDPLTDLPNRLLFQQHLERQLAVAQRTGGGVAVLFVDLNDFKLVNDSFGHAVGDELLRAVGERLCQATRAGDVVARLGGDEFLILVAAEGEVGTVRWAAESVAENVLAVFERPFELSRVEVFTSASIGVSVYPDDAADTEGLLKSADIAMYRVKEAARGGDGLAVLDSGQAADRLAAAGRLRGALEREEMVMHYQPIINLENGSMVGVEALIRWYDALHGEVLPADFIPLAERTGQIGAISDWVVQTACEQERRWRLAGLDLYVSVNLSPTLWRPAPMRRVLDTVERFGLNPDRLMIEITESAAMADARGVEPILAELHRRGLRLAIDDFGTGHSSLGRLNTMAVTTLKIDRSFVADLPGDPGASVLVSTMIQLANNLGLTPLAEGIETEAQRRFLVEHGCLIGQGFLFSRAVPAGEIEALYRRHRPMAA
jgi:diguanylate cyclase (GGDEF)-like protein/PAS domain S-box-containing protein